MSMKKIIKRIGCAIISIVLLGCIIYFGIGFYWLCTDPFGTEVYSKRNLNYIRGQSDFTFQLPQKEIFVKTSKRQGGRFIIFFAPDSLSLSNSMDSIEYSTGSLIRIIVDTMDIYSKKSDATTLNMGKNNFNIELVSDSVFYSDKIRKYPYSYIGIDTKEYGISVNQQRIKEGDIYGGW